MAIRKKRRVVWGYLDMGKPMVPPLPNHIVMEDDNAAGTFYHLTFTGTAGSLSLSLSTDLPTSSDVTTYQRFTGPYVPSGTVVGTTYRLRIQSGVLTADETLQGKRYTTLSSRVFARRNNETTVLQITAPNGSIVTTEVEL